MLFGYNFGFITAAGAGKTTSVPIITLMLIVSLSIFAAGCGELANRSNGNEAANRDLADKNGDGNKDTSESLSAGKCENEFYPIDPSSKKNYKMSGTTGGSYTLGQEITGEDRFREVRTFDNDIAVTNNWVCRDDGLRMAEYTNFISMKDGAFDMETLESSGVTLPKEWKVGSEWSSVYDIRANIKVANMSTSGDGKVTVSHRLVSLDDKVSVGGKEYSAARIDSVISMNISVKGTKVPDPKITTSNWYAKGVGLVKQEVGGGLGKQTVEYTGNAAK